MVIKLSTGSNGLRIRDPGGPCPVRVAILSFYPSVLAARNMQMSAVDCHGCFCQSGFAPSPELGFAE